MSRRELMRVALGRSSAEVVVRGGQVVDVYSGEIRRADVAISGGRIAYVGTLPDAAIGPDTRIIDATDQYVAPGLIDSHLHYHHTYLDPSQAALLLLRAGVTATVDGFYGEAIVGGIEAVRAIKKGIDSLPIRLIFLAPSQAYLQNRMFGLTPARAVSVADLKEMLTWDGCYGIDETPFSSVVQDEDDGIIEVFEAALAAGKVPTGHVSGATEAEVQAFAAMGGIVDHEAVSVDETVWRARAGIKVLMRYGSGVPDLPNLIGAYTERGISPRQLAICTDVLLPETLAEGGLDVAVRRLIASGVRPLDAIAMGSLNVAEAFRADHDMGSVSPGRYADLLLIDSLEDLSIRAVINGGEVVAEDGEILIDLPMPAYPDAMYASVNAPVMPTADDFRVTTTSADGPVKVRCVGVSSQSLVTDEIIQTLEAEGGVIQPDPAKNIALMTMVDRLDKKSGIGTAFVHGFGLTGGAIGSTHNAICENMAIVGTNAADMQLVAETLVEMGGGQVVVQDGAVIAAFPMPILGLFSDRPYDEVLQKREEIAAAAKKLGCDIDDPLLKLEFAFACAEFPLLKMSEEGLVKSSPRGRVEIEVA